MCAKEQQPLLPVAPEPWASALQLYAQWQEMHCAKEQQQLAADLRFALLQLLLLLQAPVAVVVGCCRQFLMNRCHYQLLQQNYC